MILLDTSGLYAALDRRQTAHERVREALELEPGPFIVSPFVLAEVDYFVERWLGVEGELPMLRDVAAGVYRLAHFSEEDVRAAANVIETYRDLGIGLADASLVVLAERLKTTRILTLDERHFRVMRTSAREPFTLLPADA